MMHQGLGRRMLVGAVVALGVLVTSSRAEVEAITRPSWDLSLGFTITGRVARVAVEPGSRVEAGQILATLDDRQLKAQVDLLTIRAESELAIEAAEAELKLAQNEESRVQSAFEEDAAGAFEVERAGLVTGRARIRLLLAKQKRAEARAQLAQAQVALDQTVLRAPRGGTIETVAIETGEMVQQAKPVVRLVVTDQLRIEAAVPTAHTLGLRTGQMVEVRLGMPGLERASARIESLAAVADPASGTRVVRLMLPNTDGAIPAGTMVHVALGGDQSDSRP